jgi:DNA mismatch repair ATPase MutS
VIADFYDAKVDEYRNTIKNAQDWLAKYQDKLIKET